VEGVLSHLLLHRCTESSQAFWDTTGGLWGKGALAGKYAGAFVSTAGPGGGQEVTIQNAISTLTHHGIIFVPLGYSHAPVQLGNLNEVHGGACLFSVSFSCNSSSAFFVSLLLAFLSFPFFLSLGALFLESADLSVSRLTQRA
jgi:hypothetical protein